MGRLVTLLALGLCLLAQGCGLAVQATRVVTLRACENLDDARERHRNHLWAETAWARIAPTMRARGVGPDYGDGFQAGFADYLYHGPAAGAPLPPAKYRDLNYQSLAGYYAIQQWYAGYQHGEAYAESGGFRRLVTGPPPPDYWATSPGYGNPGSARPPLQSSWEGLP